MSGAALFGTSVEASARMLPPLVVRMAGDGESGGGHEEGEEVCYAEDVCADDYHYDEEYEGEEYEEDCDDGYYDEDDDDWVLEGILQRKVDKEGGGGGGEFVYLCQWRHADGSAGGGGPSFSTTWEARDTLEEAGYIPQLDAFDGLRVSAHLTKAQQQQQQQQQRACGKKSLVKAAQRARKQEVRRQQAEEAAAAACRAATADVATDELPVALRSRLRTHGDASAADFAANALPSTAPNEAGDGFAWAEKANIAAIAHAAASPLLRTFHRYARFSDKFTSEVFQTFCAAAPRGAFVPVLLFHGVRADTLGAISEQGLKARETVVHGVHLGSGVYTSRTAERAIEGSKDQSGVHSGNAVIVCLGLVPAHMYGAEEGGTFGGEGGVLNASPPPSSLPQKVACAADPPKVRAYKDGRVVFPEPRGYVAPMWLVQTGAIDYDAVSTSRNRQQQQQQQQQHQQDLLKKPRRVGLRDMIAMAQLGFRNLPAELREAALPAE